MPDSIVKYDIEINDNIIEKITFNNKNRKNIHYLNRVEFDYYKLIDKIEIPGYSCYLNVYQKD
jgi:hypothetical protein